MKPKIQKANGGEAHLLVRLSNVVRVAIVVAIVLVCLRESRRDGFAEDRNFGKRVRVKKRVKVNTGLDPKRAFGYLRKVCRIGPRRSGSRGMAKQQKLIANHFDKFEARVRFQSFDVTHPISGKPVRMNNMIVSWHPDSKKRILLACHYDTRPYPDRDLRQPRGRFVGANDGASGVALFMELAHHMRKLKPTYGVDFVFFDGEELIYRRQGRRERGEYFLGSKYFATDYRENPPEYRYVFGVVVDMIGDRKLQIFQEKNSLNFAPALTASIWKTAADLNIREFVAVEKYDIQDDHFPLNQIAKIPSCDIIDFNYPYWHTTKDVPVNCSGSSLVTVGRVLLKWMENVPEPR